MKKIIAILMVLAMLLALTACGKKEATPAATEAPAAEEKAAEETPAEEPAAEAEAPAEEAPAEEAAEG